MTTAGRALLLTEVAAAGDSLDESLRDKVDEPARQALRRQGQARREVDAPARPGRRGAGRAEAERGGRHQDREGRRLHETDPDKAIALYEQTIQAVQAAGSLARPDSADGPPRSRWRSRSPRRTRSSSSGRWTDKQLRAEIEMKRLRILEADKAKKAKMKDLMDKAMTAYAEGKYIECEAFAKRAMEVDPNELAASMLVFKAKTERRFKTDMQNRADKEDGDRHGVPGSRHGGDRRPRGPAQGHHVCPRTSRT